MPTMPHSLWVFWGPSQPRPHHTATRRPSAACWSLGGRFSSKISAVTECRQTHPGEEGFWRRSLREFVRKRAFALTAFQFLPNKTCGELFSSQRESIKYPGATEGWFFLNDVVKNNRMAAVTGRLPRPPSSPCTGHPVGTGDTVSRGRPGALSFKERPRERMGPEPRKGTSSREQTGQCGCYPAGGRFYSDAADGAGAAVGARRLDSPLPVKDPPGSSHQVPPGCPSAADPVGSGALGRTAVTAAFILSAGESRCGRGPCTAGRLRGAACLALSRVAEKVGLAPRARLASGSR